MLLQTSAFVDTRPESRERRKHLYLVAFVGLCLILHGRALAQGYVHTTDDLSFLALMVTAALSAAMALLLGQKMGSLPSALVSPTAFVRPIQAHYEFHRPTRDDQSWLN